MFVSREEYLITSRLIKIQNNVTARLYKVPRKEEDLYGTYPYNAKNFGLTSNTISNYNSITKNSLLLKSLNKQEN